MALKFSRKGGLSSGSGGTYDHSLLVNRGLPDQHTIESITGLRGVLDRKYEKPFSGIPKTDIAFDVATLRDIDLLRKTDIADIANNLQNLTLEVVDARGDKMTLKEYIDTKVSYADWSLSNGAGGAGSHIESQVGYPLYEEFVAKDFDRKFIFTKTYEMGTHQLEVYLNGLRMVKDRDYKEVDDHTIEFLFDLEELDIVLCMVRAVVNGGLHEEFVATEGQVRFSLINPYGIYQNILQVFRNGVLQRKGRDYSEIDKHTIDFKFGLQAGDDVTFIQAGATDPIAGTIMESEIGRLKINHSLTTMLLHDAIKTTDTDYLDMYVDTFITDNSIDKVKSSQYVYQNTSISVGINDTLITELEQFTKGTISGSDIHTYPDRVVISNLIGGTEGNTFGSYQMIFDAAVEKVNDVFFMINNQRNEFHFASTTNASGVTSLTLNLTTYDEDGVGTSTVQAISNTDGDYFSLDGDTDNEGNVHLVYHEQGSTFGVSRVFYAIFDRNGVLLSNNVISNDLYNALSPSIFTEGDGTSHIVFSSNRVNATYLNIDYRYGANGTLSGFKDVSVQTTTDALNATVVVGSDKIARIIYETMILTGTNKNLKLAVFDNGIKSSEKDITTSTTFNNTLPDAAIDSNNVIKLAWRSTRLDANWGVDYCTIDTAYTISSVVTVASGSASVICSRPSVATDYEDMTHIVFHANTTDSTQNNINYSYVYPNNTITAFTDIAFLLGTSFIDPNVHAQGDQVTVGYIGASSGYKVVKKVVNYGSTATYSFIFDSEALDSKWNSVSVSDYVPANTTIAYEYQLTNDQTLWTAWKPISDLATETALGRYLRVRVTMTSSTAKATPELYSLHAFYEPSEISVQSIIKPSPSKDVISAIVVPKFEGDVTFYVSRDGGETFVKALPQAVVGLATSPLGNDVVIKAVIKKGSRINAWAVVW